MPRIFLNARNLQIGHARKGTDPVILANQGMQAQENLL
jgi:hypothetical protein